MATPAIVRADVVALAPEITALSDQFWVDMLAFVNTYDLAIAGDNAATARLARIYLAAHLGLMARRAGTGAAGPVTGETVGAVRRSYGLLAQAAGTNALNGTIYGQSLIALLMDSAAHGPFVV